MFTIGQIVSGKVIGKVDKNGISVGCFVYDSCTLCGKTRFIRRPLRGRICGSCATKERNNRYGLGFQKGHRYYGGREKPKVKVSCRYCGKQKMICPSIVKTFVYCGEECRDNDFKVRYQGNSFSKGCIPWNKGKKLPQFSGENHPNWTGMTSLKRLLYISFEYRQWRKQVFERDNYTCQECGIHNGGGKTVHFNAHHKKPFFVIFQEFLEKYDQFSPIEDKETLIRLAIKYKPFWDVSNGKTLCEDCHKKTYKDTFKWIRKNV